MYTMGFIGTGNMGSALARAASKIHKANELVLCNRTPSKARKLAEMLLCETSDSHTVAGRSKYIVLAVKPQMMSDLLSEIAPVLKERTDRFVLVTIAAGITTDKINQMADGDYPVIRIMPNTPCSIGHGVILCCKNSKVSDLEYNEFKKIMSAAGTLIDLNEAQIDAGSAISGCGPAFVYTFIEAMADAGVACGLTRADAQTLAAATVSGSAEMVLQGEGHPAQLRDNVCSPGGSTIAGVLSMDRDGFRAAVSGGILAAYEKTRELGK